MVSGAIWRRLKISAEIRNGAGSLPRLPVSELVRMLGVLAAVREGTFSSNVVDETGWSAAGSRECERLGIPTDREEPLRAAILEMARTVDAHAFL